MLIATIVVAEQLAEQQEQVQGESKVQKRGIYSGALGYGGLGYGGLGGLGYSGLGYSSGLGYGGKKNRFNDLE